MGNLKNFCCFSVTQLCLTLCNPMDCSTPGFPVLHHLPELAQIYVHWVDDINPIISFSVIPFSSCLQSFPASGSFPMSQFFASGGQSIGASTSAPVLPMNIPEYSGISFSPSWIFIQGWFPIGWTGGISLLSKELSRVLSNTTVQKHQFVSARLSL